MNTEIPEKPKNKRLLSLDALRGFDMLVLVCLQPLLLASFRIWDAPEWLRYHLRHVGWEGFAAWDLVMPLFMFMAGTALPFSMSKYRAGERVTWHFWLRLLKRLCVLWVLGMVVQGNLLSLDPDKIKLYTNTLQAIAAGYLIASLTLLIPRSRWHPLVTVFLLLAFWGAMRFCSLEYDGVLYGNGSYAKTDNLAEGIDRLLLGHWRDGASLSPEGNVRFSPGYRYTWILSSLTFGATVLFGAHAGELLRNKRFSPVMKAFLLALTGAGLCFAGWIWSFEHPVVKHLFSASFTLQAAGWSMLLLAFFYLVFDVCNVRLSTRFLSLYGTNALLAYLLGQYFNGALGAFSDRTLYGFRHLVGNEWYPLIQQTGFLILMTSILWVFHRARLYLRA